MRHALLRSWLANPFRRLTSRRLVRQWNSIEQFEERLLLTQYAVLSNADSGPDTLRQAILDANANPGADSIVFNLAADSLTIQPLTVLPFITDSVTIDGSSQPGFEGVPLVTLNGVQTEDPPLAFKNGLVINASHCTVKSLVIQNFYNCILIGGEDSSGVTGNHVEDCYIGVTATGSAVFSADNFTGVRISNGATNNVIGGTSGKGNVISGNLEGIVVEGLGTSSNLIVNNTIGPAPDGTPLGGNSVGILIYPGASHTTIGGTQAGAGNWLAGHGTGILVFGGLSSSANVIQGNLIGTNAAGTAAFDTETNAIGIDLDDSDDNLIGGTSPGARNIISGIRGRGIVVGGHSSGNIIQGNYLGVDITGTQQVQNAGDNIWILDSEENQIGGTEPGAGNVISGSGENGIFISDASNGNTVLGNLIGTDASGTVAIANVAAGIRIDDASNNTIGGTGTGARNVISGNHTDGISLMNDGATGNVILGNLIGVQVDGVSALPNTWDGVYLRLGASQNQIGGGAPGAGNVIAHNSSRGINIVDNNTLDNVIVGNSIYANAVYAIDLNMDLATANDPHDADSGPNLLQNYPVLSSATISNGVLTIQGTLNSTPDAEIRVDLYASSSDDAHGFAQGQIYLGTQSVTTSPAGSGDFAAVLTISVPAGHVISAIATGTGSGSSEFSHSVVVVDADSPNPILQVSADSINYHLGQSPVAIAPDALVTDVDSPSFNGGKLIATMLPKGKGKELLSIKNQGTAAGQISIVDGTIRFGGTAVGTYTGGKGKKPLIVTFTADASLEAVQALVRNITFQNTSKRTKASSKTVRIELIDPDNHSSGMMNVLINYA